MARGGDPPTAEGAAIMKTTHGHASGAHPDRVLVPILTVLALAGCDTQTWAPFAPPAPSTAATAGSDVYVGRAEGGYVWWCEPDCQPIEGRVRGSLTVSVGQDERQERSAYMSYQLQEHDGADWAMVELGQGPIPQEDVTGRSRDELHVATDTRATASDPAFRRWVGQGGLIDVTFESAGPLSPCSGPSPCGDPPDFTDDWPPGPCKPAGIYAWRRLVGPGSATGEVIGRALSEEDAVLSELHGMAGWVGPFCSP